MLRFVKDAAAVAAIRDVWGALASHRRTQARPIPLPLFTSLSSHPSYSIMMSPYP